MARAWVAALLLLVLVCLGNNLSHLRINRGLDPQAIGSDRVSLYEQRFAELRQLLPQRGVIGYVSDQVSRDEAAEAYYLTQYALTPLVVVEGTGPELVVGNFSNLGARPEAGGGERLTLIRDFGNGVVLFRRK